jgi:hypothetical protein
MVLRSLTGVLLFAGLLSAATRLVADDRPAKPTELEVIVDTSDAPDSADWAADAKKLVEKWHPKIAAMLPSDGFTPPMKVKLVFKKSAKFLAYTSGNTISISEDWIKKHPDDYGMVVHELTHVIQGYPHSDAGWLVEGIADYVRFFKYEPDTKLNAVNPKRAKYKDGYRTTAMFLAWLEKSEDKEIVTKLNKALRGGHYRPELFKEYTSSSLDDLWDKFLKDPAAKGR